MTMGLTAAGLTQGPEGALTPSRRPSRDNSSAFEAFGAALAQSEDAPGEGDPRSDAAARDSDATASGAATAKLADTAANPLLSRSGDRLASRMAASWLAVSGQESSRQNASSPLTSSPITSRQDSSTSASTPVWTFGMAADSSNGASSDASVAAAASQSASPRDPLAALLASPAGQSVDGAAPQPQPAQTTAASPASVPTDPRVRDAAPTAPADGARQAENAAGASIGRFLDASRPQSRVVSAEAPSARRTTQSDDGDAAAPATAALPNGMGLPDQLLLAAQGAAMTKTAASPASAAPTRSADASDSAASSAASSATAEAVARIGAALTAPAQPRANQPAAVEREPQTVSVHVVSQQSWLPPVDPNLSGGSQPQPQSFRESGAQSQKSSDGAAKGEAPALDSPTPASSQPASLSSFAALTSGFGASAASAPSTGIHAAEAPGAAASARLDLPAAPAPTLRRDLEITMTPQDLGGLQVKLKSAGDRLELAFVADRGETARMISDKTAALETQLTSAGLGLGGVAISASAAGDMSGAQTGGQGGQGSHTPSQAFGSAQDQNGGQSGGDSESTRQGRNFAGRERQDERNERGDVSRDARGPSGDRGLYL